MQSVTSNAVAKANSYSTTEQKTGGVWIDGKPIYRKVVDVGSMPNRVTKSVPHNILNLDNIINITGYARNGVEKLPLPFVSAAYNIEVYINSGNIKIGSIQDYSMYSGYVVLEYTKTTD